LKTKPRHLHTRLQAGTCADIWRKSGQIETWRGDDEKKTRGRQHCCKQQYLRTKHFLRRCL
jgi:hypothetical protein